jgi:phosphoenolpyruvate synthase/pyruvate phosphate dikinase
LREADGRCGAKAANLGRLLRAGFDVPAGFVIGDPIGDDGWGREIESALLDLGSGSFAVRSSAAGEDGRQVSFAGQLDTTLGATAAQVVQAVHRTARSGAGPEVIGYAARTGQAAGNVVSVIVQVMAEPEAAGVLFTRHPQEAPPVSSEPGKVLLRGTPASPGIAVGPVRVITGLDDVDQFRAGDVLVCRTTSPAWTPLLARATAVAREFGIPAVLAVPGAMAMLADGQQVVVDGSAGTVTAGTEEKRNR